jgi:hypothetical protein
MRQVIIHQCVICNADTDCWDSDRKGENKKRFCIDPYTGKSCLEVCPIATHPRGGSFCEKHKIEVLKEMREENKRKKDND